MSKRKKESLIGGIILLVIGLLFLMRNMGWDRAIFGQAIHIWDLVITFWPMILIYIGLRNLLLHFKKQ